MNINHENVQSWTWSVHKLVRIPVCGSEMGCEVTCICNNVDSVWILISMMQQLHVGLQTCMYQKYLGSKL